MSADSSARQENWMNCQDEKWINHYDEEWAAFIQEHAVKSPAFEPSEVTDELLPCVWNIPQG